MGLILCIMVWMIQSEKNYFKLALVFILCLLVRLIPFRTPNIEPILAATMPVGRAHGTFVSFSFAVLSILIYDFVTGTPGLHTFFTAGAYGIIACWAVFYFSAKSRSVPGGQGIAAIEYVKFAIWGTLFFDAVTGLTIGPIFFHQSFISTFVEQIPFTALHLLGNITFAFFLSPAIYHFLIRKKEKEKLPIIKTLNPKII
jgi:hypothetical protein